MTNISGDALPYFNGSLLRRTVFLVCGIVMVIVFIFVTYTDVGIMDYVYTVMKAPSFIALRKVSAQDKLLRSIMESNLTFISSVPTGKVNWHEKIRDISEMGLSMALLEHKIHQCFINKNMLTAGGYVFCYLSDSNAFARLLTANWAPGPQGRPCESKRKIPLTTALSNAQLKHVVVLRHPLDRLVSGYVHICETNSRGCYKCPYRDIGCFLQRNYDYLLQLSRKTPTKFAFVFEYHFYPQFWYCGLSHNLGPANYTIIRYEHNETFLDAFLAVYLDAGVRVESIQKAKDSLLAKTTSHSTHAKQVDRLDQVRLQILANSTLFNLFIQTYLQDFTQFGFDIPLPI